MFDDAGSDPDAAGEQAVPARPDGAGETPPWDEDPPDDQSVADDEGGNVAGIFRPADQVEPGSPNLRSALFVLSGVYIGVLTLTRLFVDVRGFDATDVLILTAATVLVGLLALGFFGLLTPDT